MQCVFFMAGQRYNWQRCCACFVSSAARRVFFGRTTISMVAMQCVFCVFWQNSNINCSDAMRVFMAGQRYQWQRCNACFVYFGRTAISILAMQCVFYGRSTKSMVAMQCVFCVFWQCVFFMAGQRYQWQRGSACFVYFSRTAISIVVI